MWVEDLTTKFKFIAEVVSDSAVAVGMVGVPQYIRTPMGWASLQCVELYQLMQPSIAISCIHLTPILTLSQRRWTQFFSSHVGRLALRKALLNHLVESERPKIFPISDGQLISLTVTSDQIVEPSIEKKSTEEKSIEEIHISALFTFHPPQTRLKNVSSNSSLSTLVDKKDDDGPLHIHEIVSQGLTSSTDFPEHILMPIELLRFLSSNADDDLGFVLHPPLMGPDLLEDVPNELPKPFREEAVNSEENKSTYFRY